MKRSRLLVFSLALLMLQSCNQGTTTLNNGGGTSGNWTVPGVGTIFVFRISEFDSTAAIDTFRVVANHLHDGGKSNVVEMVIIQNGQFTGQSAFYNIEPNGDISLGDSGTVAPGVFTWKTYPTGSHKTLDSTAISFSGFEKFIQSDKRSFIGSENVTTTAGNFSTLHVREDQAETDIDTSSSFADTIGRSETIDDYWFAPSIGLFVKETGTTSSSSLVVEADLIKYAPH